ASTPDPNRSQITGCSARTQNLSGTLRPRTRVVMRTLTLCRYRSRLAYSSMASDGGLLPARLTFMSPDRTGPLCERELLTSLNGGDTAGSCEAKICVGQSRYGA